MRIEINKDIETVYKNEVAKGLTLGECIAAVLALVAVAIAFCFVLRFADVAPSIAPFVSVPFALPFIYVGFGKVDGMNVWQYMKARYYCKRTEELCYEADELPQAKNVFTVTRTGGKRR